MTDRKQPVMLHISNTVDLPIDVIGETLAVLGMRGSGKTNLLVVLAEEILEAEQHVCIIDPIGVWWGLRSSADGTSAGLPIVIFGGDHADVQITADMGEIVAGVVLDRVSAILDLSSFKRSEQDRFVERFIDHLYEQRKQGDAPSLIIVDEAHSFMPQKPMPDQARVLGAMERFARHGRVKGLGIAVASQRAASVNKSVLNLCELLFAMRMSAAIDRKTIDDWLSGHVSEEQRKEVLASIASLGLGETYYSSAAFLRAFGRAVIRKRRTFDSSATPKVGEVLRRPKTLADVDVDALRAQFAASTATAAANDPKALKQQIEKLTRELADRPAERVEVPVLTQAQVNTLTAAIEDIRGLGKDLITVADNLASALDGKTFFRSPSIADPEEPEIVPDRRNDPEHNPAPEPPPNAVTRGFDGRSPAEARRQQKLLDALHSFAALGVPTVPKTVLLVTAGVSPTSSQPEADLRALRNDGVVETAGMHVRLTEAGKTTPWTNHQSVTTQAEYRRQWVKILKLTPKQRNLFGVLAAGRRWIKRDELADVSGISRTSSTLDATLRLLRDLGLVEFGLDRNFRATKLLFPEGLR